MEIDLYKSTAPIITRDLLGGCCAVDSKGLDLDLQVPCGWEKCLDLKVDSSDDESNVELESKGRIVRSGAALIEYDVKIIKKRIPLKFLEDEIDLSQQVEEIKEEVKLMKRMQENGREKDEEESVLSTKRFDECDVSSLTVRALTKAGYVQMTRVQEATLSAFHEGSMAAFLTFLYL